MVSTLTVYLGGQAVGVLSADDRGVMTFAYRADAAPISMSLPVRAEPYGDAACYPYFRGLLPEGDALLKAAAQRRLQTHQTFELLVAYGGECPGDIRLLPEGTVTQVQRDYEPLDDAALQDLPQAIASAPNFADDRRVRLSVAGVQTKTSVAIFDGVWHRPLRGSPSTHLVKVALNAEFETLVRNEAFCMRIAGRLGIDVPDTQFLQLGGIDCLVVERYDRIVGIGETVQVLHQEDFAQALGYAPERKYQFGDDGAEIGPSLRDCLDLTAKMRVPVTAAAALRRRAIFNLLIGNADAHAKNFSLLYDVAGRPPLLAPAYDLVCTALYPRFTTDFAMGYGAARRAEDLTADDLASLMPATARARKAFFDQIAAMTATIVGEAEALCDEAPFSHRPPFAQIVNLIGERAELLSGLVGQPVVNMRRPFLMRGGGWQQGS